MRRLAIGLMLVTLAGASGCSVCCTPFDDAYPTYGGKWERTDRFRGRVGSAFEPAGPEPMIEAETIDQPTPAAMPAANEPMAAEMPPEPEAE